MGIDAAARRASTEAIARDGAQSSWSPRRSASTSSTSSCATSAPSGRTTAARSRRSSSTGTCRSCERRRACDRAAARRRARGRLRARPVRRLAAAAAACSRRRPVRAARPPPDLAGHDRLRRAGRRDGRRATTTTSPVAARDAGRCSLGASPTDCRCSASASARSCWRWRVRAAECERGRRAPSARRAPASSVDAAAADDPLFGGTCRPPPMVGAVRTRRRSPSCPPGAVLLAGSRRVPRQAFRVGDGAWGVQYHPEVTADDLAAGPRRGQRRCIAASGPRPGDAGRGAWRPSARADRCEPWRRWPIAVRRAGGRRPAGRRRSPRRATGALASPCRRVPSAARRRAWPASASREPDAAGCRAARSSAGRPASALTRTVLARSRDRRPGPRAARAGDGWLARRLPSRPTCAAACATTPGSAPAARRARRLRGPRRPPRPPPRHWRCCSRDGRDARPCRRELRLRRRRRRRGPEPELRGRRPTGARRAAGRLPAAAAAAGRPRPRRRGSRSTTSPRELADLAAAALEAALAIARAELPDDAAPCRLAVIGMGKCGGRELNYVSDVDVDLRGRAAPRARDEATRWRPAPGSPPAMMRVCSATPARARSGRSTPRCGRRARQGPLVRTLASHVAYYERWAKTWEFQALLKARPVAGDLDARPGATSRRSRRWSGARPSRDELRRGRAGDAPPGRGARARGRGRPAAQARAGRAARRRVRRPAAAARARPRGRARCAAPNTLDGAGGAVRRRVRRPGRRAPSSPRLPVAAHARAPPPAAPAAPHARACPRTTDDLRRLGRAVGLRARRRPRS